jgi:diguanylate cyclase (GGDEF)-like protein/putative nucleotidyltransferase with HDIG domain
MDRFADFPLRARAYLLGCWALGIPTVVAALAFGSGLVRPAAAIHLRGDPASPAPLVLLPALLAAFCLGRKKVLLTRAQPGRGPGATLSVAMVTTWVVLLFLGLWPAVVASAVAEVGRGTVGRKKYPWYQVLFNVSSVSVATALAGWVYLKCGGGCGLGPPTLLPARYAVLSTLNLDTWRSLTSAILLFYAVNTFSVAAILSLTRGQALIPLWRSSFLWTAPANFAAASAAGLARAAYVGMGSAAFLTGLPIAFLIYQSYKTYLEKIDEGEKHIAHLKEAKQQLEDVYHSALESLALAIDAKDKYTRKHISRVQVYAVAIARHLGVTADELQAVRTAALLHDIGKLAVPEQILVKPGKLTQEEFKRMQSHVTTGAMMLEPVGFPWPVIPIVLTHHERWDGNGYPQGLKGDEIPLGGRIVGLADVFDALTSDRPYHRALPVEEGMALVRAGCGNQFDPRVVEAFFAIYDSVRDEIDSINAATTPFGMTSATEQGELSAGAGVERHNLLYVLDEIGRASDELYTLYETVHPLGRSLNLNETLHMIVEKTASLVPFETCAIFWLTEDGSELRAEITAGLYRERLEGMTIKVGEGLSGWVAMQGKAIRNKPASMDIARKLRPQDEIELNSSLVVPLVLDGRTVGTISLYSGALHFYIEEHLRLLTIVADHAVTAIENARCFERTREQAMTDALTGLPNARALAWRLKRAIGACGSDEEPSDTRSPDNPASEKQPLALVLIDIDNFKVVNDRLGHVAGDRVLRDVAEILVREAGASRAADPELRAPFVSRYAGDEFVVVLPGASRAQARALAASIQRRLTEYHVSEAPGASMDSWNGAGVTRRAEPGYPPTAPKTGAGEERFDRDSGQRRGPDPGRLGRAADSGGGRAPGDRSGSRHGDAARRLGAAEGRGLWSGASAGVALFPDDAADARALIHCADQRMYRDKFSRKREMERQLPAPSSPLPAGQGPIPYRAGSRERGAGSRSEATAPASLPAVALRTGGQAAGQERFRAEDEDLLSSTRQMPLS